MTARRIEFITPFHVMALLARARELEAQGRSIVHMEIGEPDFSTPQPIIDAGIRALQEGRTHYTPAVGLRQLREAIARDYRKHDGLDIDPRRILVTPGASGALQLLLALLVDPGSDVLMADPGYPCNSNFVRLFDARPVRVPVSADQHYQLDAASIEKHWADNTCCAMIASPSNPTGTVIAPDRLEALYHAVRQRGGSLIVDEIYQGLTYGERPRSALALGDDVFVINSFSKYQGMTGWRLGWLVAPEAHIDALDALAQNLFLAAPTLAQYAALAAYEDDAQAIIESRRQAFQQRRDYLLPALTALGFDIPVQPEGAFYLYANCERLTDDSFVFTHDVLEQAGVAITPGIDFGDWQVKQHVRFAYTTGMDNLKLGVERIAGHLKK
ncbi:aspartate/methionine/tyrosine aminotransferase [Thiogranum longum]|uniref:Aminotransferase n=1 Tax=Thiogranum longum TaxID=1537524 RepID=A0A4R1HD35_9GAMM|nr:pyridoxal phosphate-dependent aminotransferase [Thiogranum longum]TCK18581.1 aspartate/methionine/tyrosine aminotransferase [Thiogranum longum]